MAYLHHLPPSVPSLARRDQPGHDGVQGMPRDEREEVKTEAEIREKLEEMLAIDSTGRYQDVPGRTNVFSKVAACKALLWALGENDDDRWHITAKPGPPVDVRVRARN